VLLGFLDLADRLPGETVAVGFDLARFQRAPEGSGQSAGGGRDDVIERGRARLEGPGRDLVVLRHGAMDAEHDRLRLAGEVRTPHRSLHPLDADLGAIYDAGLGSHAARTREPCGEFPTESRRAVHSSKIRFPPISPGAPP
jgi:hypothetical protein